MQVFGSKIGLAPYIEVAFYHKKAKALMVTDAVVYIPEDPPEACQSSTCAMPHLLSTVASCCNAAKSASFILCIAVSVQLEFISDTCQ